MAEKQDSKVVINGRGAGWKNPDWAQPTDPGFRGELKLEHDLPAGTYWLSFWAMVFLACWAVWKSSRSF